MKYLTGNFQTNFSASWMRFLVKPPSEECHWTFTVDTSTLVQHVKVMTWCCQAISH